MSLRKPSLMAALMALVVGVTAGLTAQPRAVAAADASLDLTASYTVDASFAWNKRTAAVDTIVSVRNTSAGSVSSLVFNLTPLLLGKARIEDVIVDGHAAAHSTADQTLYVTLPKALAHGATSTVQIDYTAMLSSSSKGAGWLFARTSVLTAYRWIPWLSRPINFAASWRGDPWETSVSPQVKVTLHTDRQLKIAATGQRTGTSANGLVQTFVATNVRDFNFSAAPDYRTRSKSIVIAGKTVRVTFYYRTLSPSVVLEWSVAALRDYSAKVGPYAYPQLNIGEIDGHGGAIESPGHFWLPAGTSASLLPWEVAHETGHQWFYAVVGNDQPAQPFADEAVVDFMARNLVNRWAKPQCSEQNLDQSVARAGKCYAWVIYVQGNLYLRAYRDKVGNTAFWRGLANYYAAHRWGIAGTRQLLDALDAAAHITYPHWKRFPSLYP